MALKLSLAAVGLVLVFFAALVFLQSSSDPKAKPGQAARPPAGQIAATSTPQPIDPRALTFRVEVSRKSQVIWPASGVISSYFGLGHPTGIDIALDMSQDVPVVAGAGGTVSFAGSDSEYGLNLVIDHDGGLSTRYGHLSRIDVAQGQAVEQGDTLGLGDSTGTANGKHLHFEVRRDGQLVDPLRYLPANRRLSSTQVISCPNDSISLDVASDVNLTFLPAVSVDAKIDKISVSDGEPKVGIAAPAVQVRGALTAALSTAPAPIAAGDLVRFRLEASITQGGAEGLVVCRLELSTLATLPNSSDTIASYLGRLSGATDEDGDGVPDLPPPPSPTPTPTYVKPPATATKSTPAPTKTTGPAATATPRGPQGIKSPTPRPGPGSR